MKKKAKRIDQLDRRMKANQEPAATLRWMDPAKEPFQLVGFPWFATERLYRRLPLHPKEKLSEGVDVLAYHTAGGQIRFRTDSRRVSLRVRLMSPPQMSHMAVSGQGGFDAYMGPVGRQQYVGTARPNTGAKEYETAVAALPDDALRQITVNFPLYAGVEEVLVGVDEEARVLPPLPFENARPIVIYGTSCTQGGCACRPGMAWTNIVSRRINRPFINLGFSGNGRGEPEVARLIAEIPDPALYILDYEGNCYPFANLKKTLPVFIRTLRRKHRSVPILVMTRNPFTGDLFRPEQMKERRARRDFERGVVRRLARKGDRHIRYLDGAILFGKDDGDGTVDGVHPTDLGFLRMADAVTPVVRKMLRQ